MSIRKIAEITGLSITTVSHALNGTRAVSQKSRDLIEKTAKEIGYKPNLAAQMLKTQRSKIIALIIPNNEPNDSTNYFFFDMLEGVKEALDKKGYDMIVSTYSVDADEECMKELSVLQKQWIDGVLLAPSNRHQYKLAKYLEELELPVVLLDRRLDKCKLPMVYSDNTTAVAESIELLYRCNRRKIAYLGGHLEFSTAHDRLSTYKSTLKKLQLPYDPALVRTDSKFRLEEGYRFTKELLAAGADAIFVASSNLMLGLMLYCNENNVKIPGDLSVVGFVHTEWSEISNPPITTLWHSPNLIGERGAEVLIDMIENKTQRPKNIILPMELVIRKSHGTISMQKTGD